MHSSLWMDVLQEFKAREVDEAVLFVIEDGWLRRALVAWLAMPNIRRPRDYDITPVAWGALWEKVEFDLKIFADHLDTWEGHAKQLFERARALMLIYPDGTIHSKAQRLIRERVTEALKKDDEKDGDVDG